MRRSIGPARHRIAALDRPVTDLSRSIAFYVDALGFEIDLTEQDRAILRLGHERIVLFLVDAVGLPVDGPDTRFQHAAIVAGDMVVAFERLMATAPRCITQGGPQALPAGAGGVTAFKFRDPDGHPLELIAFPPSSGDARWQRKTAPTLGIDHFALSVRDASVSIGFYERTFGFELVSRHLNHGPEQARLDGLPLSTVDVLAFAPGEPGTPHIELLAYREPVARPNAPSRAVDRLWIASDAARASRVDPDGHTLCIGDHG